MNAAESRALKQIEDDLDQANETEDFDDYGALVSHISTMVFFVRTGRVKEVEPFNFDEEADDVPESK